MVRIIVLVTRYFIRYYSMQNYRTDFFKKMIAVCGCRQSYLYITLSVYLKEEATFLKKLRLRKECMTTSYVKLKSSKCWGLYSKYKPW